MGAQQSSGIGNLFSSTAHHVVMLGLDSAGKTTGKVCLYSDNIMAKTRGHKTPWFKEKAIVVFIKGHGTF